MSKEQIIPVELATEATQYGIEPSKAANIIGNLPQITSERDQFVSQYDHIIKLDIEDPNTSKLARELRLRIRDNRTKGIAVWHKTTKDYFLKGGQFVDAIKRKEEAVNVRMEEALEEIEKYQEIKLAKMRDELRRKREEELHPYREFVPFGLDLGTIPDEEYTKVFKGAKLQYDADLIEKQKAEEERLEAERLQKRYDEHRMALMPYYDVIENFDTLDFANLSDLEIGAIIQVSKDKKAKLMAEAEEAKKRAEEAEAAMAEERKKAEAERLKMEAKLKKEQEEKQKLEAELKKQREAEEKRLAEEKKKERELKNASDKVILLEVAKRIEGVCIDLPKLKGEEAKVIMQETEAYMQKMAAYVKSQAESLTK